MPRCEAASITLPFDGCPLSPVRPWAVFVPRAALLWAGHLSGRHFHPLTPPPRPLPQESLLGDDLFAGVCGSPALPSLADFPCLADELEEQVKAMEYDV